MAYRDVILADLPAGGSFWELGEASGTFADSGSAGVVGTAQGAVERQKPGPFAGSYSVGFAATSAIGITFGDNFDFLGTSSFSLEIWQFLRAYPAGTGIAGLFHKHTTSGFRFCYDNNPTRCFIQRYDNVGGVDTLTVNGNPRISKWYYWGVSYDGTNMRIYRNGNLVGGPTASAKSIVDEASNFQIGLAQNNSDQLVALPAVYPGVVLSTQFLTHYEAATQYGLPDADNAAGGWTTTPLWSKVDDVPTSDAVVISAVAS